MVGLNWFLGEWSGVLGFVFVDGRIFGNGGVWFV